MANKNDRYDDLAKKIEILVLPICKCRQENKNLSLQEFNENILDRDLNKKRLDIIISIYEYMQEEPIWKSTFNSEQLMIVFDTCLKSYKPIGKSFLNSFFYIYSKRIKKEYNRELLILDKPLSNKDDNAGNHTSVMDKKTSADYIEDTSTCVLHDLYEYASHRLKNDDLNYLRYFITSHMLLLYMDEKRFVSDDYKFWGENLAILFEQRITEKKLFPFIDLDFLYEQLDKTPSYLLEFKKEKEISGKSMQEKAFLNGKYRAAIADKLGMKSSRMRTKENMRQNFFIEASKLFRLK